MWKDIAKYYHITGIPNDARRRRRFRKRGWARVARAVIFISITVTEHVDPYY